MEKERPSTWGSRLKWLLLVGVPGILVFFATNKAEDVLENLNSWTLLLGLTGFSMAVAGKLVLEPQGVRHRRALTALFNGNTYVLAVCVFALAIKGVTLIV